MQKKPSKRKGKSPLTKREVTRAFGRQTELELDDFEEDLFERIQRWKRKPTTPKEFVSPRLIFEEITDLIEKPRKGRNDKKRLSYLLHEMGYHNLSDDLYADTFGGTK